MIKYVMFQPWVFDKALMKFVSYTGWDQLPESADVLFSQSERNSIFFSRQWFENLQSTTLEEGQTLLLACVIDGDCVFAIFPIMKRENGYWHSFSNYNSSLFNLLLADDEHDNQWRLHSTYLLSCKA